jgi:methylenetetrahydrofolate dehydrogenase (NADP+)/methenyltetrahydrofolate cyclohydrolase
MTAKIIDGKQIAADMRAELKAEVAELAKKGIVPGLGVILVGDDPASISYVTAKERDCSEIGIYSDDNRLPETTSQKELLSLIGKMNKNPKIHGILVQLPLPKQINKSEVLLAIDPAKDVDGFHPINVGKMVTGQKAFLPCTPHGVIQLLIKSGVKIEGANIVIVAAAGCPNTITADMIKTGAVVIDVGMNRVDDPSKKTGYRLAGDVDFENVKEKASLITPVPGGVGPMTITMLLYNTVESAKHAAGLLK